MAATRPCTIRGESRKASRVHCCSPVVIDIRRSHAHAEIVFATVFFVVAAVMRCEAVAWSSLTYGVG